MFRITELSIAAVSVVCLGLFGCGGDGDGSSGGAVSGGSGKVVSCDVKTSQAGYEAESCTEVPESSPAAEPMGKRPSTRNVLMLVMIPVRPIIQAPHRQEKSIRAILMIFLEITAWKSARRPLMPRVSRLVATCQAGLLEQAAQFLRRNVLMIKQSHIFTIPMI